MKILAAMSDGVESSVTAARTVGRWAHSSMTW
jgi:tRNA U34 2-thiouridine synthase MnmA/TrmU